MIRKVTTTPTITAKTIILKPKRDKVSPVVSKSKFNRNVKTNFSIVNDNV